MNYLLYGTEEYLLKNKLDSIIKESDPEYTKMDTFFYDGKQDTFSIQNVIDDCDTFPFFLKKKVIVIENPMFISTTGKVLEDADMKALDQYLNHPNPSCDLVFYCNFNIDGKRKTTKLIKKLCSSFELNQLDINEFSSYVDSELKMRKIKIDKDARSALLERLPNNLQTVNNELDKLALYGKDIDKTAVEKLINRNIDDDVFMLVNAVINKNIKKTMQCYNDMISLNKEPIYLLMMLASQFRFIFEIKALNENGYNSKDISQKLNAHPYRVQKGFESSYNMKSSDCLKILSDLANLEQNYKKGMVDINQGLELFLLNVAR